MSMHACLNVLRMHDDAVSRNQCRPWMFVSAHPGQSAKEWMRAYRFLERCRQPGDRLRRAHRQGRGQQLARACDDRLQSAHAGRLSGLRRGRRLWKNHLSVPGHANMLLYGVHWDMHEGNSWKALHGPDVMRHSSAGPRRSNDPTFFYSPGSPQSRCPSGARI